MRRTAILLHRWLVHSGEGVRSDGGHQKRYLQSIKRTDGRPPQFRGRNSGYPLLALSHVDSDATKRISLLSDNRSALLLAHNRTSYRQGQRLALAIRQLATKLPAHVRLRFFLTPGQKGLDLNEKADKVAKEATEIMEEPIALSSSLGSAMRKIKLDHGISKMFFDPGSRNLKSQPKEVSDALALLKTGKDNVIFQL